MRSLTPYGTTESTFWDGDIGARLQRRSWQSLLLFQYLQANPHANMIGLYRLRLEDVLSELFILGTMEAVVTAFDVLDLEEFVLYDGDAQCVWVKRMAARRLFPKSPEKVIDRDDARWIAVCSTYRDVPANAFTGMFFDLYERQFNLVPRERREGTVWRVKAGGKLVRSPGTL